MLEHLMQALLTSYRFKIVRCDGFTEQVNDAFTCSLIIL